MCIRDRIKNEWLSNLWLVLELLVVSVVMWYVVDYLYTRAATYLAVSYTHLDVYKRQSWDPPVVENLRC